MLSIRRKSPSTVVRDLQDVTIATQQYSERKKIYFYGNTERTEFSSFLKFFFSKKTILA